MFKLYVILKPDGERTVPLSDASITMELVREIGGVIEVYEFTPGPNPTISFVETWD